MSVQWIVLLQTMKNHVAKKAGHLCFHASGLSSCPAATDHMCSCLCFTLPHYMWLLAHYLGYKVYDTVNLCIKSTSHCTETLPLMPLANFSHFLGLANLSFSVSLTVNAPLGTWQSLVFICVMSVVPSLGGSHRDCTRWSGKSTVYLPPRLARGFTDVFCLFASTLFTEMEVKHKVMKIYWGILCYF